MPEYKPQGSQDGWVAGKINNGLQFNRNNSEKVSANVSNFISGNHSYSYSTWVKLTTDNHGQEWPIVWYGNDNWEGVPAVMIVDGNRVDSVHYGDDVIVVMASDEEGNEYSPLESFDVDHNYRAENTWSGVIGYRELTDELEQQGYGDEDIMTDGIPCVVLWPVN